MCLLKFYIPQHLFAVKRSPCDTLMVNGISPDYLLKCNKTIQNLFILNSKSPKAVCNLLYKSDVGTAQLGWLIQPYNGINWGRSSRRSISKVVHSRGWLQGRNCSWGFRYLSTWGSPLGNLDCLTVWWLGFKSKGSKKNWKLPFSQSLDLETSIASLLLYSNGRAVKDPTRIQRERTQAFPLSEGGG